MLSTFGAEGGAAFAPCFQGMTPARRACAACHFPRGMVPYLWAVHPYGFTCRQSAPLRVLCAKPFVLLSKAAALSCFANDGSIRRCLGADDCAGAAAVRGRVRRSRLCLLPGTRDQTVRVYLSRLNLSDRMDLTLISPLQRDPRSRAAGCIFRAGSEVAVLLRDGALYLYYEGMSPAGRAERPAAARRGGRGEAAST